MSLFDDIKAAQLPKQTSRQYAMVDSYLVDCSVSEDHAFESEISEYPVESGSDITDNVRRKPTVVTMECLVTNSPIGAIANQRDPVNEPVDECYEHLQKMLDAALPVTIRTSLRTFENMVCKNLTIPRTSATGAAVHFTATFQPITLVTNKRFVRVAIPAATPNTTVNKPPIPVTTTALDTRMVDKLGHWFDPNVAGWRQGAVFNKVVANDGNGVTVTPGPGILDPIAVDRTQNTLWDLYKGRPLTVPQTVWSAGHLTDKDILDINELAPDVANDAIDRNVGQDITVLTRNQYTLRG